MRAASLKPRATACRRQRQRPVGVTLDQLLAPGLGELSVLVGQRHRAAHQAGCVVGVVRGIVANARQVIRGRGETGVVSQSQPALGEGRQEVAIGLAKTAVRGPRFQGSLDVQPRLFESRDSGVKVPAFVVQLGQVRECACQSILIIGNQGQFNRQLLPNAKGITPGRFRRLRPAGDMQHMSQVVIAFGQLLPIPENGAGLGYDLFPQLQRQAVGLLRFRVLPLTRQQVSPDRWSRWRVPSEIRVLPESPPSVSSEFRSA